LLYAEHTYTSSGGYSRPESEQSVRQIESKHFHVTDAREAAHWIAQESMSRLLESIHIAPPAIVVFNSLAHERSGLVEMDLSNGTALAEAGRPASRARNGARGGGLPACALPRRARTGHGISRLPARWPPADRATRPRRSPGNVAENAFYRVTVNPDRGGISSIFDKQTGRELVDPRSPYLLDQYLYVSGGEGTRLIHLTEHLPAAKLTVSLPAARPM
jgi:alpha-mannosidase